MARITPMSGIESISGKIGNIVYTTRKDGSVHAHLYKPYRRKTQPSERELAARKRFARICAEVTRRQQNGDTRPRNTIFREISNEWKSAEN